MALHQGSQRCALDGGEEEAERQKRQSSEHSNLTGEERGRPQWDHGRQALDRPVQSALPGSGQRGATSEEVGERSRDFTRRGGGPSPQPESAADGVGAATAAAAAGAPVWGTEGRGGAAVSSSSGVRRRYRGGDIRQFISHGAHSKRD